MYYALLENVKGLFNPKVKSTDLLVMFLHTLASDNSRACAHILKQGRK